MRRQSLVPTGLALIALAALAALGWELDVLRSGTQIVSYFNHDWFSEFLPRHHFAGATLRNGELPLWDPHQIAGLPFLATLQAGVLYPPNLLYAVLPTGTAMGVLGFLHVLLAGIFTYALGRELGRSRAAAWLAGVTFMLGGSTLFLILHTNAINSAPWLPAALLCAARVLRTGSLRWTSLLALCFALQFLAGRDYTFVMSVYVVGLFALLASIGRLRESVAPREVGARVAQLGLAGALALLLVGAQLLPTLALSLQSGRPLSGLEPERLELFGPLPPGLFFANFVNPARGPLRPQYLGWIPLLCFALGFRLWGRDRAAVFTSVLALLAALLCFGSQTPLYAAWRTLPLGTSFRLPDRFVFLFALALALGAAGGFDRVFAAGDRRARARGLLPGALLAAGGGAALLLALANGWFTDGLARAAEPWGWFMYYGVDSRHYAGMGRAGVYLGLAGLLLAAGARFADTRAARPLQLAILLATAVDLLYALESPGLHPARSAAPAFAGAACHRAAASVTGPLGRHLSFRLPESYALKDKDGELFSSYSATHYDPLVTRRHALYFAALQEGGTAMSESPWDARALFMGFLTAYPTPDRFRLLDLMGTRAILADGRELRRPPALSALLERFERRERCLVPTPRGAIPVDLYANPGALPRAFLVERVSQAASPEAALRRMLEPDFDLRREAVVEGDVPVGATTGAGSVEILSHEATRVALRARRETPGLLVFTDAFDADWRATRNGDETAILPTDALFRGVWLPAGESEVEFVYRPRAFGWGVALSAVGAALWAGLWLRGSGVGPRRSAGAPLRTGPPA